MSEWIENAETEQDTETVENVEHTSIPSYYHINPGGNREPFSPEDNRIIYRAQNQGLRSVAVAPVNIGERVLNFEVRFGNNARSAKMPRPSPTGMCQVNLANQNTRVVERQEPKRRRETVETESSHTGSVASSESARCSDYYADTDEPQAKRAPTSTAASSFRSWGFSS